MHGKGMSIAKKVVLSLVAFLVLFLLLEYSILYKIVLPGFSSLQTDAAIQNADRCQDAINSELSHLETLGIDWSAWNDIYQFVQDNNQQFRDDTLVDDVFTSGTFDLLYICDLKGKIVYGKSYNPEKGTMIDLDEFSASNLSSDHWLLNHTSTESSITGILSTEAGLIMLASSPVITSQYEGPIKGSLIMGRFLNSAKVNQISKQVGVDFTLSVDETNEDGENFPRLIQQNDKQYAIYDRSAGPIRVDQEIVCLNGTPLRISSTTPDQIISKGRSITKLSLLFGIGISSVSLVSVLLPLNNIVLKSIGSICSFVKRVTETGDLSMRAEVTGDRELQTLGRNINNMLFALQKNEKEITLARIEAEDASNTKNLFLANMSHEIRTPMNAIVGFSDLLAEEDLNSRQMGYLDTIRDSNENLLNLINDILDFSRIEAGKLAINPSEHSVNDILTAIESPMLSLANKKGLAFTISTHKDLSAKIYTDSHRLQQCLINLISNAIKFTEKGHIFIDVSSDLKNDQHCIRFDVEDTGIGISCENQEAIFESFTQEDPSTSRVYGGTGLGLAITKQLAELLGGELSLTSEQGKGSVFTLTIPLGLEPVETACQKSTIIKALTDNEKMASCKYQGRVLVAEDVETNQILIKLLLKKMGFEVTIVGDGLEAVEKVMSQKFDLILMDMHMPVMNGFQATKEIKKQGVETPIVALTANVMTGDREKCLEAGCCDYLPKPIETAELEKVIAELLVSYTNHD